MPIYGAVREPVLVYGAVLEQESADWNPPSPPHTHTPSLPHSSNPFPSLPPSSRSFPRLLLLPPLPPPLLSHSAASSPRPPQNSFAHLPRFSETSDANSIPDPRLLSPSVQDKRGKRGPDSGKEEPMMTRILEPRMTRILEPMMTRIHEPMMTRILEPRMTRILEDADSDT